MSLLDRVEGRSPLSNHDGRSGATIETGWLDGAKVYVKTAPTGGDAAAIVVGNDHIELDLFEAGYFDRLPDCVGAALLSVERTDAGTVTVTRDLGSSILSWDRVLTAHEVDRIFGAIAAVHDSGRPPGVALCPLETRLGLFSPNGLEAMASAGLDLAEPIRRGHMVFRELVPDDVAEAVDRNLTTPAPLAAAMSATEVTLLHGDFWMVNIAIEPRRVVLLDWGLATSGPPALDLLTFCVGATSNVDVSRDELVERARSSCRHCDPAVFALAEFWTLMELGWNKALDAVDHPEPSRRCVAAADLAFWVKRARRALDAGLVP